MVRVHSLQEVVGAEGEAVHGSHIDEVRPIRHQLSETAYQLCPTEIHHVPQGLLEQPVPDTVYRCRDSSREGKRLSGGGEICAILSYAHAHPPPPLPPLPTQHAHNDSRPTAAIWRLVKRQLLVYWPLECSTNHYLKIKSMRE